MPTEAGTLQECRVALIWYDGWQMECCGDPFAMGDVVEWTLDDHPDVAWLGAAVGDELARQIAYAEEHHEDGGPGTTRRAGGAVRTIRCAFCDFGRIVDGDDASHPVPGTAALVAADRVDGTEGRGGGRRELGRRFIGYVVELDLVSREDVTPARFT